MTNKDIFKYDMHAHIHRRARGLLSYVGKLKKFVTLQTDVATAVA